MPVSTETVEGYVIDIACLRKYPRSEWGDRAQVHTRECTLMGHCVESGYGLVRGDDGVVTLLDDEATASVVEAVRRSPRERGIRLRAAREMHEGEMRTVSVEEI